MTSVVMEMAGGRTACTLAPSRGTMPLGVLEDDEVNQNRFEPWGSKCMAFSRKLGVMFGGVAR